METVPDEGTFESVSVLVGLRLIVLQWIFVKSVTITLRSQHRSILSLYDLGYSQIRLLLVIQSQSREFCPINRVLTHSFTCFVVVSLTIFVRCHENMMS